jgi:hypothetical protein
MFEHHNHDAVQAFEVTSQRRRRALSAHRAAGSLWLVASARDLRRTVGMHEKAMSELKVLVPNDARKQIAPL